MPRGPARRVAGPPQDHSPTPRPTLTLETFPCILTHPTQASESAHVDDAMEVDRAVSLEDTSLEMSRRSAAFSGLAAAVSWGYLRAWVFPRYVIGVIAFESGEAWRSWVDGHEGFVPPKYLAFGYSLFLVPLVLLWLLSCAWLTQLVSTILTALSIIVSDEVHEGAAILYNMHATVYVAHALGAGQGDRAEGQEVAHVGVGAPVPQGAAPLPL